jgi:hypothetical protein
MTNSEYGISERALGKGRHAEGHLASMISEAGAIAAAFAAAPDRCAAQREHRNASDPTGRGYGTG